VLVGAALLLGPLLIAVLVKQGPEARDAARDTVARMTVEQLRPEVRRHTQPLGLDENLVLAIIHAESGGRTAVVSEADAVGLMQITPVTLEEARRRLDMPRGDLTDPAYNIRVGTAYLHYLLDRFDHDLPVVLAAYNRGPTHVSRLRRQYPNLTGQQLVDQHLNSVTRRYVADVLEEQARLSG
jgi:soluble lytic murein transglycosylase-like protein